MSADNRMRHTLYVASLLPAIRLKLCIARIYRYWPIFVLTILALNARSSWAEAGSFIGLWHPRATRIMQIATRYAIPAEQTEHDSAIRLRLSTDNLFPEHQDKLTSKGKMLMESLGRELTNLPGLHISLTGHAHLPARGYNPVLFGWRLSALRQSLVACGIPATQIRAQVLDTAEHPIPPEEILRYGQEVQLAILPTQP